MYHANEVRQGRRKFWSPALPVDLLIAVGMGVIGHALCVWLGVSGAVESGVVAVAGYLGPHGIDALFEWKFGKSEKKDR